MTMPPRKGPYDLLIEQFLANTQGLAEANQNRFALQRQERLVEEDRAHQEQVRQEGYARQDTLEAQRRAQALTDAANQYRMREIEAMREVMAYLPPDSEEFQNFQRAFRRLQQPLGLTGQEAFDYATSGRLELEDGEVIDLHPLMARGQRIRRNTISDESLIADVRTRALDYMSNPAIALEDKQEYFDNYVLGSPELFGDEMHGPLLAAVGITDPAAVQEVIDNQTMRGIAINQANVDLRRSKLLFDREQWEFGQDQRLADLTYDEAVERVEGLRLQNGASRLEAFLTFGTIPTDDAQQQRLANQMGLDSVEELREMGARRFERMQRLEGMEEDLLANQITLVGEQIDDAVLTRKRNQLLYEREKVFGDLTARTDLAATAFAAATMGDVQTLQVLQGLQQSGLYDDVLGDFQLDTLIERAEMVLATEGEEREYAKFLRGQDRANQTLLFESSLEDFVESIGSTRFTDGEWSEGEDGRMPVQNDIEEYLSTFGDAFFENMGVTREQMGERLLQSARRAKVLEDQGVAATTMQTLLANPPFAETAQEDGFTTAPGAETPRTREQQEWLALFTTLGEQAGLDPEVVEAIAEGALTGANMDHWKARLDGEFIQAQRDNLLANARATNAETDAAAAGGVILDKDTHDSARLSISSEIDSINDTLNSGHCRIDEASGGPSRDWNPLHATECQGLHERKLQLQNELTNLRNAFITGNPYSFLAGASLSVTEDVRAMEFMDALENMEDVRLDDVNLLFQEAPQALTLLREEMEAGTIRDGRGVNEFVAGAFADLGIVVDRGGEVTHRPLEQTEINVNTREWRNLSAPARADRLQGVSEWQQAVQDFLNGDGPEPGSDEEVALARQFGFTEAAGKLSWESGPLGIPYAPEWVRKPNFAALRAALRHAAGRERVRASAPGRQGGDGRGPGADTPTPTQDAPAPATPVAEGDPSANVDEAVFRALIGQESGGAHQGGGYAGSPRDLTESVVGALGLTQLMPTTMWQPGLPGVPPLVRVSDEDNATLEGLNSRLKAAQERAKRTGDYTERNAIRREMQAIIRPYAERLTEDDFRQFGRRYLGGLMARFEGQEQQLEKALAAYNAGFGAVEDAIAASANSELTWLEHLPRQTQEYVPSILARVRSQARAR